MLLIFVGIGRGLGRRSICRGRDDLLDFEFLGLCSISFVNGGYFLVEDGRRVFCLVVFSLV